MRDTEHDPLRRVAFFSELDEAAFRSLSDACHRRKFNARELVIGHKDQSFDVLFLLEGLARVSIYSPGGRQVSFRDIAPGAIFGELSAIDGEARSASVECVEACTAAIMPRQAFLRALGEHPAFMMAVMKHPTGQVRSLTDGCSSSARWWCATVADRVAAARRSGASGNQGSCPPARPTRRSPAELVPTARRSPASGLARGRGFIAKEARLLRVRNSPGRGSRGGVLGRRAMCTAASMMVDGIDAGRRCLLRDPTAPVRRPRPSRRSGRSGSVPHDPVANVTGLDRIGLPVVLPRGPTAVGSRVEGKGTSLEPAEVSVVMEAIELWHEENILRPMVFATRRDRPRRQGDRRRRLPRVADRPLFRWPAHALDRRNRPRVRQAGPHPHEMVHADDTHPVPPGDGCFPASTNGLHRQRSPRSHLPRHRRGDRARRDHAVASLPEDVRAPR